MGVSHKNLSRWYMQTGQNLDAGISFGQAMQSAGGAPAKDVTVMAQQLQASLSIDEVFKNAPSWLPQADRLLISAAGTSGRIPDSLKKLSERHKLAADNISRAVFATLYPLGVLHLGVLIFPLLDLVEFTDSGSMQFHPEAYFGNVLVVLLPLWAIIGAIIFLAGKNSPVIHYLMRCLPGLRGYSKAKAIADFSFALESFLNAGAPMAESWFASGMISGNPNLENATLQITQQIKAGQPPGNFIGQYKIFPEEFVTLYKTGEQTGQLDINLHLLTRQFQEKADQSLSVASAWYPKLIFFIIAIYAGIKMMGFYSQYLGGILKMIE